MMSLSCWDCETTERCGSNHLENGTQECLPSLLPSEFRDSTPNEDTSYENRAADGDQDREDDGPDKLIARRAGALLTEVTPHKVAWDTVEKIGA
jgi:hypothetical protein